MSPECQKFEQLMNALHVGNMEEGSVLRRVEHEVPQLDEEERNRAAIWTMTAIKELVREGWVPLDVLEPMVVVALALPLKHRTPEPGYAPDDVYLLFSVSSVTQNDHIFRMFELLRVWRAANDPSFKMPEEDKDVGTDKGTGTDGGADDRGRDEDRSDGRPRPEKWFNPSRN